MLELKYDALALGDMARIPLDIQDRIENAIRLKLLNHPELYGVKLRGILKDYWKLRVGDYRVAFIPEKKRVTIKAVGHRKEIYKTLERRST